MEPPARPVYGRASCAPVRSRHPARSRLGPAGLIVMLVVLSLGLAVSALATPREYKTFRREQRKDYSPDPRSLLRIWITYVGQGDGILIQLPTRYNYDTGPGDAAQPDSERIDVLVDGGSYYAGNQPLMGQFIRQLYPNDTPVIEHAVITHHDSDHITGLTRLINDDVARVETFYHNGLVSWLPGGYFPSPIPSGQKAVYLGTKAVPTRGMAYTTDQETLDEDYLIDNFAELKEAFDAGHLHGLYHDLAEAIDRLADYDESVEFRRTYVGGDFINDVEQDRRSAVPEVKFELLWPERPALPYKSRDWGYTINGNSLAFRLVFGEFQMLFTGDHNEKSQDSLLSKLVAANRTDALECDVFKVPHHGSYHFDPDFIDSVLDGLVLSVASMGSKGFGHSWKHPNPLLINRLGRAHRFYSTYIHERRFDTSWFRDASALATLVEDDRRTILIETDGDWFRLVEIPVDHENLNVPPTVKSTHSGNGTRWINAKKGD